MIPFTIVPVQNGFIIRPTYDDYSRGPNLCASPQDTFVFNSLEDVASNLQKLHDHFQRPMNERLS